MANKRQHNTAPPSLRAAEGELAAEWVSIDQLVPWVENPRKNEEAVPQVKASIHRFGFASPIVARKENHEIIAGHTRYLAAKELGLTHVPVRYLDLDAIDAHLLALADNKTGEIAEWDERRLGDILNELKKEVGDVETGMGFDNAELERLVQEAEARVKAFAENPNVVGDDALKDPPALVFRRHKIGMTEEEESRFKRALKGYIDETGTTFGFAGRLINGV